MNRNEVKVVDDNVEGILSEAISQYENAPGKSYNQRTLSVCLLMFMPCVKAWQDKVLMRRFVKHSRNLPPVLRWIYAVKRLVVIDYSNARRAPFCVLALTANIHLWLFQKARVFRSLMTLNLSR